MNKIYLTYAVLALVMVFFGADSAFAAAPAGVCTHDATFNIPGTFNPLTTIANGITCVLYGRIVPGCTGVGVAEAMFKTVALNSSYIYAARALLALYIVVYAISFTLGIVQVTIIDFFMRVVKIGIIIALVSSNSWQFFYNTVGYFFKSGTDWLIFISTKIGSGNLAGFNAAQPFGLIDNAVRGAFSARMFVTLYAIFTTGPYGPILGIILFMSLGSFLAAVFQALWIYLMALVVRAFLFGLAPIFIPMILFSKTQHLFTNWLNQLVGTMLQPVFLFTFFSFFLVLMKTALDYMLSVNVCYLPGAGLFRGSPIDEVIPRFSLRNNDTGLFEPYGGSWGWTGPLDNLPPNISKPIFPIDVTMIFAFLLLAQLAGRFNTVALNIAREISGAALNLNMQGAFSDMLNRGKSSAGGGASNATRSSTRKIKAPEAKQVGVDADKKSIDKAGAVADVKRKFGDMASRSRNRDIT